VYGVINTNWQHAIEAYTQFNGTNEHIAIRDVRVPRALVATVVGANLGVAGALLQALTFHHNFGAAAHVQRPFLVICVDCHFALSIQYNGVNGS